VTIVLVLVLVALLVAVGLVLLRRSSEQDRSRPDAGFGLAERLEADRIQREVTGTPDPVASASTSGPVSSRGAPPVEGAQWDEVRGGWIRWDAAANDWVPVADQPGGA
jgi:hypothetical protein